MARKIKRKAIMVLGLVFFGIVGMFQNLPFIKKDSLSESDLANLISETAHADVYDSGPFYDPGPPCPGPGPCAP